MDPEVMTIHTELVAALRDGRPRAAGRAALALARAGVWDRVVAAVIELHAPAGAPERARAAAELDAGVLAEALEEDPASPAAWMALIDALVDAGRAEDALAGLSLAADAGLVGPEPWQALARTLVACGRADLAITVLEELLRRVQ